MIHQNACRDGSVEGFNLSAHRQGDDEVTFFTQQTGDAFTLLTADEIDFAKSVECFINQKIERRKLDGFDYAYTALLDTNVRPLRKPRPAARRRR